MKEYEKLAAEWRRTHVPVLEVQLCRPLTMRELNFISLTYESAFLKCQEMALELPIVNASSKLHEYGYVFVNRHLLEELGEKEV